MYPDTQRPNHRPARIFVAMGLGIAVGVALPLAAAHADVLPAAQVHGKITYLSGGVGQEESAAIEQAAPRYPLELEFVKRGPKGHGEYLAGDSVTIRDQSGKTVLETKAQGPFLLAKLPPGKYTVAAADQGKTERRQVDIAAHGHERLLFAW